MQNTEYLNKDAVLTKWGEDFAEFADDPRVKFTDDKVEVSLKTSIPGLDGSTDTISLTAPDAGMMTQLDNAKGDVTKSLVLVRLCSGLPQASVSKIKSYDFIFIQKVAACFL